MSFLTIEAISKNFSQENDSNLEVLKDINLEIKKKEFVTLIGPSGCGKSTLLNIIAGLVKTDSGSIFLNNQAVTGPGKDRVMVFQEAALYPWLNVIQNTMFGLKSSKIPNKEAYHLASKQLKSVNLASFEDFYPHQLSGGMKQRVAIARALVMDPEVLLMDEPFGALDEQTRLMLQQELMKIWQKSDKTILFVTHNIREAVKLSDRIIVLGTNPGRIIKKFSIDLPQPRARESKELILLENQILDLLEGELINEGGWNHEQAIIA